MNKFTREKYSTIIFFFFSINKIQYIYKIIFDNLIKYDYSEINKE